MGPAATEERLMDYRGETRITDLPAVQYREVWDVNQGRYVNVTEVLDHEHGASRLPGLVQKDLARDTVRRARSMMERVPIW
jgi:hypothetical protein